MNQMLKKHLSQLILETKLPWAECLPLALLGIQTAPRKDLGGSPYKMMFGLLYLGGSGEMPTLKTKAKFLKNYILRLSASLLSLKECGLLAQTSPL